MLQYNVLMIMKRLDPSVKHWDDTEGATRMTPSATCKLQCSYSCGINCGMTC
ncbi:hypothetical protein [Wolbachia endosymbiont (group A) of Pogonocherus hispidulus]|uniref:hypothetical protein n=1 Tax=Wolbachia endosymbiont (group A) of Pogonocherus hispidulus TaxID=3066136 RepID=UPI00333EBB4F